MFCLFYTQVLGDGVKSCIIDTEAVAWDREKKQILPFQILSTRKRKVTPRYILIIYIFSWQYIS